ncbi:hypothetical protein PIB30_055286 [Stylosanthes scabra]|uniref:PB1-like domain-containing protein n=1 Tax=Stylosanthes scabra TaxID=79078 RepID=A0ABU6VIA8_9FABA|nr:hypothetical protein [Stylosanthes scabra]
MPFRCFAGIEPDRKRRRGLNGLHVCVTVPTSPWERRRCRIEVPNHLHRSLCDRPRRCGVAGVALSRRREQSASLVKMATLFVVPVIHFGGKLTMNERGELVYENGQVAKFDEMDIEQVKFGEIEKLYKSIGFKSYKRLYWLDSNAGDLEVGLNWLVGEAGIHQLCSHVRSRIGESNEFHIYVEHGIDVPHVVPIIDALKENVETINLEELSSSDDGGYESVEDEAYKPPPPGYEGDTESDDVSSEAGKMHGKRQISKKMVEPKGKGVAKDESKKKSSVKKAAGVSMEGVGGSSIFDDDIPNVRPHAGQGRTKFYQSQFEPLDEGIVYEYESEALYTPVSSEEEYINITSLSSMMNMLSVKATSR